MSRQGIAPDVKDLSLAKPGEDLIDWTGRQTSVLLGLRERFAKEQSLKVRCAEVRHGVHRAIRPASGKRGLNLSPRAERADVYGASMQA